MVVLGCALTTIPLVTNALNYQFMHRSPLSYFTEQDLEISNAVALEMLNSGADGEVFEWRNEISAFRPQPADMRSRCLHCLRRQ